MLNFNEVFELKIYSRQYSFNEGYSMPHAKRMISLYIKDRTGKEVDVSAIQPVEKFEKAITIAHNWFNRDVGI